jgi:CubicO group peptidase (beta-lactamase class C family)
MSGTVARGFEPVRDAFAQGFADGWEVGSALCVVRGGEVVVDLAGGSVSPGGAPYTPETLQLVYSTTKGLMSIAVLVAADRGLLDLDAPVRSLWPELSATADNDLTVRQLMSHQAGVPAVDTPLLPEDVWGWDGLVAALEKQQPLWAPGEQHGYHAVTWGFLVGEVVRRTTGVSPGQWFRDVVAGPLGLDAWIGLPPEQQSRVAPLVPGPVLVDPDVAVRMQALMAPPSLTWRAMTLDGMSWGTDADPFNLPQMHRAEIPSANGIATARAVAHAYAASLPSGGLVAPAVLADAMVAQVHGPDLVLTVPTRFGTGFGLYDAGTPMLSEASFGHSGSGGSMGFADVDADVALGYVMNATVTAAGPDPRVARIVEALRSCLDG